MTNNFFYQFSQVTQKTGLLRLFVESSSDQGPLVGIESFEDLLGEPTKETLVVSMIISYIELGWVGCEELCRLGRMLFNEAEGDTPNANMPDLSVGPGLVARNRG